MLRYLLIANFRQDQVSTVWTPSTRHIVPAVEALIDDAWNQVLARPGIKLFDGPVCRFERWHHDANLLQINISRTSYRVLAGTNFLNPQLADSFGPDVMGNSMGVSNGLLTHDNYWLLGRRNHSVAYYPGRIHPFAGSIEVRDHVDIFEDARRELREEIHLQPDDISKMMLRGLVEDNALRHPEAIFTCHSRLTRDELVKLLDRDEHEGTFSVVNEPAAVANALADSDLTPVARAVLLLGGREHFGQAWFDAESEKYTPH